MPIRSRRVSSPWVQLVHHRSRETDASFFSFFLVESSAPVHPRVSVSVQACISETVDRPSTQDHVAAMGCREGRRSASVAVEDC